MSGIRPIAICVFRHEGRILVFKGGDEAEGRVFCRPVGGGIEFGESGEVAVRREIQEELGAEMQNVHLLGVLENIFRYQERQGHEVVFVFDGEFVDRRLYEVERIAGNENGDRFWAEWQPVSFFREQQDVPLYPVGLIDLL